LNTIAYVGHKTLEEQLAHQFEFAGELLLFWSLLMSESSTLKSDMSCFQNPKAWPSSVVPPFW
jgi:hypothetical protein